MIWQSEGAKHRALRNTMVGVSDLDKLSLALEVRLEPSRSCSGDAEVVRQAVNEDGGGRLPIGDLCRL